MKDIKDYLHLYLECEAMYGGYGDPEKVVRIFGFSLRDGVQFQFQHTGEADTDRAIDYFKPILRPLSSMTEEEAKGYWVEAFPNNGYELNNKTRVINSVHTVGVIAPLFMVLLTKHFDLFGLIEAGLAVDATTLKTTI